MRNDELARGGNRLGRNPESQEDNGEQCAVRFLADLDSAPCSAGFQPAFKRFSNLNAEFNKPQSEEVALSGRDIGRGRQAKIGQNSSISSERLNYKNDGSALELHDNKVSRLTTTEGEVVQFAREDDGKLKTITVGDGRKKVTKEDDGRWVLKEKLPGGAEQRSELKGEPKIDKDGSFSLENKDGVTKVFKTDGSTISKRADGHVIHVEFADGTSRVTTWKGEGKDATESFIITLRKDGSKAEQIQAADGGLFDRFTWQAGAAADKYTWAGKIESVRSYPDGELYTRKQGEARGFYEHSDKSKVQLDDQERVTKLISSNGDLREFGYFDKGNDVKWAKLPNGSYLTRDSAETDFNFVTTDVYGQQTQSPGKLRLQVVDGIYRWYKTDGSDPHWHIFQANGTERLLTDGNGRAVTDGSGKIKSYLYAPTGREVKLDEKGYPSRISERDGRSWRLTDASAGEWTSNTGEKQKLTVSDGQYSYKGKDGVTRTFNLDGTEKRQNKDGTSFTLSADRIISATDRAGKVISYKYDGDKLCQIEDAYGTTWKRKTDNPGQWQLSGKMTGTASGDLMVTAEGAFRFEGTKEAKRLFVNRILDGTTTESWGSRKTIARADGSATEIRYEGEADQSAVATISKYSGDGKLALQYDRQPGTEGFSTKWKSDKRDDFEGEISVTPVGDLLFRKLNADKSVSTLAEDGRTLEKAHASGVVRKFEYDVRGRLNAELEFKDRDDKKPLVWKREGVTNLWKAADGKIWTGNDRLAAAGGILWQPKGKGGDDWDVTRAGKTETLKGSLTTSSDGSCIFEGKSGDQKVRLERTAGGAFIDRRADETNVYRQDGSATKVTYTGDGANRKIVSVQEYDAGGVESLKYERKSGDSPLTSLWHSDKKGDFKGDISLNLAGDLLLSKKNSDNTVTSKDLKDRVREQIYLDGTIRKFEYDSDGQMRQLTRFKDKDDKSPSIWKRYGSTDFWISHQGSVWEARFEIKDGKFTITDEESQQTKQADGTETVDKSKRFSFSTVADKQLANLMEAAGEKIDDRAELSQLKADIDQFSARAKAYGLPAAEVARTCRELARILVTPNETPIPKSDKVMLALHAAKLFADPTSTDQGYHNTCNVTTIESMLCTKQPSSVAKLLADVSATGKFVTADGSTITPDAGSLKPDIEANFRQPIDGRRSFASQVFQLTAVNVYWQRQSTMPDGTAAGLGNIVFTQAKGPKAFPSDTKDRMINRASGHILMQADSAGKLRPDDAPHLTLPPLVDIAKQISGKEFPNFIIASTAVPGAVGEGIINFGSVDELHTRLKELSEGTEKTADGATIPKLPIILAVHTSKPPFKGSSSQGGSGGDTSGYHVVTITAYDPITGMVSIDNQWGRPWDHLGRADGKQRIHIRELYPATYQ
jgi:hypothetical protein